MCTHMLERERPSQLMWLPLPPPFPLLFHKAQNLQHVVLTVQAIKFLFGSSPYEPMFFSGKRTSSHFRRMAHFRKRVNKVVIAKDTCRFIQKHFLRTVGLTSSSFPGNATGLAHTLIESNSSA